MKCDAEECKQDAELSLCYACVSRNKYVMFAILQPSDFQIIIPPEVFTNLYPNAKLKPISTLEVFASYMAAVDYFNVMFNPDLEFPYSENWNIEAYGDREYAMELWHEERIPFEAALVACNMDDAGLRIVQALERRVILGQCICDFMNNRVGKDPKKREWVLLANQTMKSVGSTSLVPWPENRCPKDGLAKLIQKAQDWNSVRNDMKTRFLAEHPTTSQQ